MNSTDLIALSPLIVIAVTAVAVLMVIAFRRDHVLVTTLTLIGLAAAFGTLSLASIAAPRDVAPLLRIDDFALFFMGLLFAATFAITFLTHDYLAKHQLNREEFYVLLLIGVLGGSVLAASTHFASLFLGLETLTLALYVLIAYQFTSQRSIEAGIKYLVLAAVASAFLLFGMALIYAEWGTMSFVNLPDRVDLSQPSLLVFAGLGMFIVGAGFKLAVVPFHMWTADVYHGAPAPATAFVATVSKGAVVAVLLRLSSGLQLTAYDSFLLALALIAIASMFVGNLLALLQQNVKRILAYSSIAHLGYLLIGFQVGGELGITAITYYITAYLITILIAFGVVTILSDREREAETLDDYQGLFWQRPWLAGIFTAALLSLAGIPLTAGFIAKFYIVVAGVSEALWALVLILVVNSAIGLYYYLRIVVAMYRPLPEAEPAAAPPSLSLAGSVVLAGLTLLLVWFGVYPAPLIDMIEAGIAGL